MNLEIASKLKDFRSKANLTKSSVKGQLVGLKVLLSLKEDLESEEYECLSAAWVEFLQGESIKPTYMEIDKLLGKYDKKNMNKLVLQSFCNPGGN